MPRLIAKRVSPRTGKVSWTAQIAVGTQPNGKPKYIAKTFKREGEAKLWLAQQRQAKALGTLATPRRVSLSEYLDEWLAYLRTAGTIRGNTLAHYETFTELYIKPTLGARRLSTLTARAVEAAWSELLGRGVARSTLRAVHGVLAACIAYARRHGDLAHNPLEAVTLPVAPRRPMTCLDAEQVRAFLDAASTSRLFPVFVVALATGARPSEYLALQWRDVDLVVGAVTISRALLTYSGKSEYRDGQGKTDGALRRVPISTREIAVLKSWRARQATERFKAGTVWQDERGLVFTDEVGRELDRGFVGRGMKKILAAAGLPATVRLYDLRHTSATLALATGVHPKVVAERLGHSSITTTMDIYSHVIKSVASDAADVLSAALWGEGCNRDTNGTAGR